MTDDPNAEPNFQNIDDVDRYVAMFGEEHMIRRMMELRFHPDNRRVVEVWRWWQAEKDRKRALAATETSAAASLEATNAARESAKWAMYATVIATVALIVSCVKG